MALPEFGKEGLTLSLCGLAFLVRLLQPCALPLEIWYGALIEATCIDRGRAGGDGPRIAGALVSAEIGHRVLVLVRDTVPVLQSNAIGVAQSEPAS